METKIEALEPRTSGASFFLLFNHVGNQHIASQLAGVTDSDSVVYQVIAVSKNSREVLSRGAVHLADLGLALV